jgi:hypothetical protein
MGKNYKITLTTLRSTKAKVLTFYWGKIAEDVETVRSR